MKNEIRLDIDFSNWEGQIILKLKCFWNAQKILNNNLYFLDFEITIWNIIQNIFNKKNSCRWMYNLDF